MHNEEKTHNISRLKIRLHFTYMNHQQVQCKKTPKVDLPLAFFEKRDFGKVSSIFVEKSAHDKKCR